MKLKMMAVAVLEAYASPLLCGDFSVASPDSSVQLKVFLLNQSRLGYEVTFKGKQVIDKSPLGIAVNNLDLGQKVQIRNTDRYEINETYPWRGVHARAVNRSNGAKLSITHEQSGTVYILDVRAFNDGIAFCYVVPGKGSRTVQSEVTSFVLPEGSTAWYHDFYMHYEGIHQKKNISDAQAGEWAASPLTFELPHHAGYAAISEAAIINYSGMGLQADGQRGFRVRLGHEVPASYPYTLRYGEEEAKRLSAPAAIDGEIKTPWRVVMIGADLNTLLNSDIIHNLAPAPDQSLFPEGFATPWLKPGRAVWGYLNNGGRTLEAMKEFSRLAGELGFEYHVVEGHWQSWPESEQKELVGYSQACHVSVIFWKHSRELRDPQKRREFFEHLHKLGVAGAKIDFFDHEAKEIMDLYQACLREAAEYQLVIDFHGANKPAGEARTWPNELTREGIRGYEFRGPWATHNTTLPFTRMLAGHADYTPMHFGDRRTDTSEAHQIASAIIFTSPLLIYAEHPQNILNHKAVELIKKIPAVWDETIVLRVSAIGEVAAFARRTGEKWFIALMNGSAARGVTIELSTFLQEGEYQAVLVRDEKGSSATVSLVRKRESFGPRPGVIVDTTTVKNNDSFFVELLAGGGFVALISK
jgi:alpha-glucosidase